MFCKRCRHCLSQAGPEVQHHCDFTGADVFPNTELRADWCPLDLRCMNYDERQAALTILHEADRRGKLPELFGAVNGFQRMMLKDLIAGERVTA